MLDLLNFLAYNKQDGVDDINDGKLNAKVNKKQIQRLSVVSTRKDFQGWMTEQTSSALLINGKSQYCSPLSHFCAQMAEEYDGLGKCIFLTYFCGMQQRQQQQRDPGTMLCQLIGQLITIARKSLFAPPHFGFIDPHDSKKMKQRDVKVLCKTFRCLVDQLKSAHIVVYCVIDSISTFEVFDKWKDTDMVLKTLLKIVRQKRSNENKMLFKLMVTDNKSSLYAWKHFELEERIDMVKDTCGYTSTNFQL
jgi:hypothetical protein